MAEGLHVQLRKGVLEMCVLALLAKEDSYAYEIADRLSGAIGMGEGTIYPLMRRMQSDGLVKTYLKESSSGPPRKYYSLTKAGRTAFGTHAQEWDTFTSSVGKLLKAAASPGAAKIGAVA